MAHVVDKHNIEQLFAELSSSPNGLSQAEAEYRRRKWGPNEIEEKRKNLLLTILKYFWGPIPWMIEIAAVLSFFIHHYADFVLISMLLLFNALVAFWQEYQSGNAIEALKRKLALKCKVRRDGVWREIDAVALVPGDVINLRLGDIVPADAVLTQGDYVQIDQSVITGESLPVLKTSEEIAYSGSIVQKGEMQAVVKATGKETYFGKTVKLVAASQTASHFQKAVLQIGDFLIYVCLALVAVMLIVQISRHAPLFELLKFALILTVASIPVAMPAVLSVTMAIGALALSRMKAIVTKLESIEEMAGIDTLCCDKTGTLTYNQLTMGPPYLPDNGVQSDLFLAGALACRIEDLDAIDKVVLDSLQDPARLRGYVQSKFIPFDPVSKRTEALIKGPDGKTFKVSKGAPQVILALCPPEEGRKNQVSLKVEEFANKGYRTIGVARSDDGMNWRFLGLIPLYDKVRDDSKEMIQQAKEHGLDVKMLTGDHLAIAKEVSKQVGIGGKIDNIQELIEESKEKNLEAVARQVEAADGFSQVFPESKFLVVKALQSKGHIVGMTGDGVNDAPALKQADLGIAVSGATDAARAAASLVLTASGLSVIIRAIEEARRIFERMNNYAIYRIAETIRIMFFMVLAMLIYNLYPISAFMLILLALLNDIPIMAIAYDNAPLPPKPVKWEMRKVLLISCALGSIGIISSFLLFIISDSWLHVSFDQLQSIIFLKLSLAGHMTLFVVRARHTFWSPPYPALILFSAILLTQIAAALMVGFGLWMTPIPWSYIGYIWLYAIVWMFIADRVKLALYSHFALSASHHQAFFARLKQRISTHHRR